MKLSLGTSLCFIGVLVTTVLGGSNYRPVVIWHGMGDSYDSASMERAMSSIEEVHEGIQVYAIRLSDDGSEDQKKTLFGVVNDQVDLVCDQLKDVKGLEDGFDGVGFSQGGLFLRAYAERCNDPPLKTLITFGSPHNGIADLPACGENDFLCKRRNQFIVSRAYSEFAQTHSVNAQYFRDPETYDIYLNRSHFLADINNERDEKNATYKEKLSTLERLVLILFDEDETVVPKESSWFQEYNKTSGIVTPLEKRELYTEDWLGLKVLGSNGLIEYLKLPGAHMQISEEDLSNISKRYLGNVQEDKKSFGGKFLAGLQSVLSFGYTL